jgi:MOSC domain-containing protein YiiM
MARVAALLIADGKGFVSRSVPSLELTFQGIPGHRHAGRTRRSDARTPWHPRGTAIANTRQVSIVSVEECALVAQALGLPHLDPALLGANIVVGALDGLTQLSPATRLQVPSGATIFITEPNAPCRQPGRKIAQAHGNPELELAFPQQAIGLRGLVGLIESEGVIGVGDPIKVIAPPYNGARAPLVRRRSPA